MGLITRKRSSQDVEEEQPVEEPTNKKRRLQHTLPQTPPPEEELNFCPAKPLLFDDFSRELMTRSIAAVLSHVGFDGASREAMESFCCEVDTYMTHFLSQVTLAMYSARRGQPIAPDFEYALCKFDIPRASIEPHLKPPIPPLKIQVELDDPPERVLDAKDAARLFGEELSGDKEKESKPFIPKRFPSFPSKHTYKWTEKESMRETDPRKIREQAAIVARQGEESLRKIMKVSKALAEKNMLETVKESPRSFKRHQLWDQLMDDLTKDSPPGKVKNDERCVIVNSEKQYWRKPALKKRKQTALDVFETIEK